MTSQTGAETITTNILPDFSKGKTNQSMKLGQLIEHKYPLGRLVPDHLLCFKKTLYEVKASG